MTASHKEDNLRSRLFNCMKHHWIPTRIESGTGKGIPDLYFTIPKCPGWMELKVIESFPVRPETKVRIDHFYSEQKLWIERNGAIGGNVWMLVYVENINQYFLMPWWFAHQCDQFNKAAWYEYSYVLRELDANILYKHLIGGMGNKYQPSRVWLPLSKALNS